MKYVFSSYDKEKLKNIKNYMIYELGIHKFSIPIEGFKLSRIHLIVKEILSCRQAEELQLYCDLMKKNDNLNDYMWSYEKHIVRVMTQYFTQKFAISCTHVNAKNVKEIEKLLFLELKKVLKWDSQVDPRLIAEAMKELIFNKFKRGNSLLKDTALYSYLVSVSHYDFDRS